MPVQLSAVVFADVVVAAIEDRVFGGVQTSADDRLLPVQSKPIKFLGAHAFVDVDCQSSHQEVL